jgi:hypothetical protein
LVQVELELLDLVAQVVQELILQHWDLQHRAAAAVALTLQGLPQAHQVAVAEQEKYLVGYRVQVPHKDLPVATVLHTLIVPQQAVAAAVEPVLWD